MLPGLNRYSLIFTLITFSSLYSEIVTAAESVNLVGLFSGKAIVMIDGQNHVLSPGQQINGVTFIKVIGEDAVLDVDGKQQRYSMGSGVSLDFAAPEVTRKTLYSNQRGMFHTVGSINGQTVEFIVDTGATTVAMSDTQAEKLNIQYRLYGKETTASTASGIARAYLIKLKNVKVGDISQNNVQGVVIEGGYPSKVLLGMSFLNRIRVEKNGDTMILEAR